MRTRDVPHPVRLFFIGPDGTGKTEISRALAKRIGVPRFKPNIEKELWRADAFRYSLQFDLLLPQFVEQTNGEFVSDRGYPCEWVYSQVFGRETYPTILKRIDDEWARLGAIHVLCRKSDYSNARPDELVPNEKLVALDAKYAEFGMWTSCDTVVLDVDGFRRASGVYDVDGQVQRLCDMVDALRIRRHFASLYGALVDVATLERARAK